MQGIMPLLCNAAVTGEAANSLLRHAFSSLWKSAEPRAPPRGTQRTSKLEPARCADRITRQPRTSATDRLASRQRRHGRTLELDVATGSTRARVASAAAMGDACNEFAQRNAAGWQL